MNFYQDQLDPEEHTKERWCPALVAGKEELNFEDLQEGNNLLFKYVPGGFITGEKKSSSKNRQKL